MAGLVIRTFLVDGEPEGLRTMELSNATVLGTFFPRPALNRFLARAAADRPGVYILSGAEPEGEDLRGERAYIGEGDPVGPRLRMHAVQKDFWNQAAVFTSKDDYLTKTQIQFLEASLITDARAAARATLDNGNVPTLPNVSEADRAEVEAFLGYVRMLLGVGGIQLLRPTVGEIEESGGHEFVYNVKGAEARMVRTTTGYVVRKGSTVVQEFTGSAPVSLRTARQRLLDSGVLNERAAGLLQFSEDYEFDSPSGAAMMVCGHTANGRICWKLADGRTLAQVEETETVERS